MTPWSLLEYAQAQFNPGTAVAEGPRKKIVKPISMEINVMMTNIVNTRKSHFLNLVFF